MPCPAVEPQCCARYHQTMITTLCHGAVASPLAFAVLAA